MKTREQMTEAEREAYDAELARLEAEQAAEAEATRTAAVEAARAQFAGRTTVVPHAAANDTDSQDTPSQPGGLFVGRSFGERGFNINTKYGRNDDAFYRAIAGGLRQRSADHIVGQPKSSSGGVLIAEEWYSGIIAGISEGSPLADGRVMNVVPMSKDVMKVPYLSQDVAVPTDKQDEAAAYDLTGAVRSAFQLAELVARKYGDKITLSEELLEDSDRNLVEFVTPRIANAFARRREHYIINGTGSANAQPQGILPTVAGVTSTATNDVELADEVENMAFLLKDGYVNNAVFLAPRNVISRLNRLRGADGQKLLVNGRDSRFDSPRLRVIAGIPVFEVNSIPTVTDVDAVTAGNQNGSHLILGDFSAVGQGYIFGLRRGLTTRTSTEGENFENDTVSIKFSERYDGRVGNAEAITVLRNIAF